MDVKLAETLCQDFGFWLVRDSYSRTYDLIPSSSRFGSYSAGTVMLRFAEEWFNSAYEDLFEEMLNEISFVLTFYSIRDMSGIGDIRRMSEQCYEDYVKKAIERSHGHVVN